MTARLTPAAFGLWLLALLTQPLATPHAAAEPVARPVNLRLRPAPPRSLTMRPSVSVAQRAAGAPQPAATSAAAPVDAPPASGAAAASPSNLPTFAATTAPALRRGDESLSFRFDLGFALDGAALSGDPTLAGHALTPGSLAEVRSYGFGDVFLGSRGLFLPNVTAYLSAYYRIAQSLGAQPPIAEPRGFTNDLQIRSGWAELRDPATQRWLSPLRVRAGRFYIYGPWVTHVDGFTAAWDGRAFQAAATFGGRVIGLTSGEAGGGLPSILGQLSMRGDLTALRRRLPVVVGAELLALRGYTHGRAHLTWQPGPNLGLHGAVRMRDGAVVNEQLTLRARFREINSLHAELTHRHQDDWRWDPSVVTREDLDSSASRRYLELGPVLPRMTAQLRAGTVLFDNVDLLARVATAIDLSSDDGPKSSFSAGYLELGGALEVRLRRTLAVGASLSTRATRRQPAAAIVDGPDASPLPADGTYGERTFVEAGATMRLSLGARTLTFTGELYGRRTGFAPLYVSATPDDPATEVPEQTTHLGGRGSVDAWIGRTLRVMAKYEIVSQHKRAPEITGYKSLRVIMEATF